MVNLPVIIGGEPDAPIVEGIASVPNVAALASLSVTNGDTIVINGYYAAGDGGGQTVYYNASSIASVNNGTVFQGPSGVGRFLTTASGYINIRQFGAKGDGATDDTAALQAAIDAAANTGRAAYVPSGTYKITSTVLITTVGNSGIQKYLSLVGDGETLSVIAWAGSTSGTAIKITYNKYFEISGLAINNTVAKGTTIGVLQTGPNVGGGTQTLAGTFRHFAVSGFDVGMLAGETLPTAASEILYDHVGFYSNNTGWQSNDFNSLDHQFVMLLLDANGTGLWSKTGNCSVWGGSASGSTITDFTSSSGGSPFSIRDYRSETAAAFYSAGQPRNVTIESCKVVAPQSEWSIDVHKPTNFRIIGCEIEGKVRITHGPASLTVENSSIASASGKLPFEVPPGGSAGHIYYDCRNNRRTITAGDVFSRMPDRRGLIINDTDTASNNRLLKTQFADSGTKAVTFVRDVTVGVTSASSTITFASGVITQEDVGRQIILDDVGAAGADITNWIETMLSSTTAKLGFEGTYLPASTNASTAAHVGENEPDANYSLGISSSADETISWSSKATTGFTLTSSNASSTATVDVIIVR
jgi:hypothetical protein